MIELKFWHLIVAILFIYFINTQKEGYSTSPTTQHEALGYGIYPHFSYYPDYAETSTCSKYRWVHGPGYYSTSPFGKDKKRDMYHSPKNIYNPIDYTK